MKIFVTAAVSLLLPQALGFLHPTSNFNLIHKSVKPAKISSLPVNMAFPTVEDEQDVEVFDSEGSFSWKQFKDAQDEAIKTLSKQDMMYCWEYGECPVDENMFLSRWNRVPYSAEREPETYTKFDSEGNWEAEDPSAWSHKWFSDNGEDDLHEEVIDTATAGYDI
ncbi:unnamed protein product [Discosporangium mesarthrocarpum]